MSTIDSRVISSPQKNNIAVLGSAFNPPTLGHLSIIKRLTAFDNILLVPSFKHAWGKKMAPFALRCDWVKAFIKDIGISNLSLCTDEQFIHNNEAVTTWALLNHIQAKYPDAELTFVLGPDNLLAFNQFYKADAILAKWNLFCSPETVQIRSSMIREALLKNEDIQSFTTVSIAKNIKAQDFIDS